MPKLSFPKFYGENPKIWIDKSRDYFKIFNIPECMRTTAASLHLEDNVARWLQTYKLKYGLGGWNTFVSAVEKKFGAYDYRKEFFVNKHDDGYEAILFRVVWNI